MADQYNDQSTIHRQPTRNQSELESEILVLETPSPSGAYQDQSGSSAHPSVEGLNLTKP